MTTPIVIDRQPLAQARALARRSILSTFRQPSVFLPGLLFPMLIAAVNSSALAKAIHFFPAPQPKSFLDFVMAATIVQGVLFGGITAGSDLALDIENGFFERLLASPVSRSAILLGRFAGAAVMGAVQVAVFVTIFTIFGARVQGGAAGVLVLLVTAVVLSVGIAGLAAAIGLRTGSAEAVQNSFPLVFILIFISSAFFPTELMHGWYRAAATHNPISWMIDGLRHQVIVGFDLGEAVKAVGVAAAIVGLAMVVAIRQLQRRLSVSG
ncbi:MAG: ABC transporter permease [Acidimicrobiales bacterium]